MPRTRLNKKYKEARLSDENDVIEAWLTEKKDRHHIEHVSHKYRFEQTRDDVIRLTETISKDTGEVIQGDASELSQIAVELIQSDDAMEVQDKQGLMVAELKVV